jgi:hypothetical protein
MKFNDSAAIYRPQQAGGTEMREWLNRIATEQSKDVPTFLYGAFRPAFPSVEKPFAVVYELLPPPQRNVCWGTVVVQACYTIDPRCNTGGPVIDGLNLR